MTKTLVSVLLILIVVVVLYGLYLKMKYAKKEKTWVKKSKQYEDAIAANLKNINRIEKERDKLREKAHTPGNASARFNSLNKD